MTIIDLQRRLVQVGAIRIGTTVETDKKTRGGKAVRRPVRLETFRLTSADHLRLDAAAELYGGQVVKWDQRPGEFELVTEARELDVMVPPGQTISQWWELWGQRAANGPIECLRRCDGQTEHLNDSPCKCPIYDERAELAKDGKACKPTTRLSVILPRVPGIGTWRLVSHGVYAAIELAGVAEFLEGATARRAIVPARLRIDQRRAVRGGKTITWPVPVLDLDITVERLAMLEAGELPTRELPTAASPSIEAGSERPALEASTGKGYQPLPPANGTTVAEAIDTIASAEKPAPRKGQVPMGPVAELPATRPLAVDEEEPEAEATPPAPRVAVINDAQLKRFWAIARGRGVPEDSVRVMLGMYAGVESSREIPLGHYDDVIHALEAWEAPDEFAAETGSTLPEPALFEPPPEPPRPYVDHG